MGHRPAHRSPRGGESPSGYQETETGSRARARGAGLRLRFGRRRPHARPRHPSRPPSRRPRWPQRPRSSPDVRPRRVGRQLAPELRVGDLLLEGHGDHELTLAAGLGPADLGLGREGVPPTSCSSSWLMVHSQGSCR